MTEESYSVKEIVDLTRREQTTGFSRLEVLLATKADKADVEKLRSDLNTHREVTNHRFESLEDARVAADAVTANKKTSQTDRAAFWGLVAASAAALGGIAAAIIYAVH